MTSSAVAGGRAIEFSRESAKGANARNRKGEAARQRLPTLRDGAVVWDLNGLAAKDWRTAGEYGLLEVYGEERTGPLLKRLLEWSA